jgi:hypothetical protein
MRRSLAFLLQNAVVEKSSKFKSGEYGGESAKNQNSATAAN